MKVLFPLFTAGVFGMLINSAPAAAETTWTGKADNQDFSDPGNWSDRKAPAEPQGIYEIANGDTVELKGNTDIGRLFVNGGSTLNIRSGEHVHGQGGRNVRDIYFRDSGGIINHEDGLCDIGHMVAIGSGNADQGGAYYLRGGHLRIARGSSSFLGKDATGLASVSLEVGDTLSTNTALLDITGGAELSTRVGVALGPNGIFSVTGAEARIKIGGIRNNDGEWSQQPGGTLRALIDTDGVTPVQLADADDTRGVFIKFQPGSLLELGFAPDTEARNGSWVVFEAENTPLDDGTVSGLSLSPKVTDSGWSFSAETRDGHGVIVATYEPKVFEEPE